MCRRSVLLWVLISDGSDVFDDVISCHSFRFVTSTPFELSDRGLSRYRWKRLIWK